MPRSQLQSGGLADQASLSTASLRLRERALAVMPGGNTRTTVYMGTRQLYARSGSGCFIEDADGVVRLDCLNNYTALIHGHAHPAINAAVAAQLTRGASFSLPTESEIELAELLCARVASIEQVRFTNSGTEAVMMAVKAARAYTGRAKIAKIEGAYHGSYDYVEVSEDSSPEEWGSDMPAAIPYSEGNSPAVLSETVILPFNDVAATEAIVRLNARDLAAIIVDPLPPRVGLIPASDTWIGAVRQLCDEYGIVLISDEVISFRTSFGGAQAAFGFRADITALGKIIGGGFPVGALGGRADIMAVFDPSHGKPRVPHGGTFNANPTTMVAGRAAMELLDQRTIDRLEMLGSRAATGISGAFAAAGREGQVTRRGSLLRIHLTSRPLTDYRSAYPSALMRSTMSALASGLLDRGVLIAPSGLIALSTAMTETEIDYLVEAVVAVLAS